MKITVKQVFNEIQSLNPKESTISSIGTFVTNQSQQMADAKLREILELLPENSTAYKIARSECHFTEKQLWVISYELFKNAEFCENLAKEIEVLEKEVEFEKSKRAAKRAAKKIREAELDKIKKANENLHEDIQHAQFGKGKVVSISETTITINFKNYGEKTLLKKFARIERV